MLKQIGRFTSLIPNHYILADTIPVNVDHDVHAGGPTMFT